MEKARLSSLVLRVGIAVTFLYAAIDSFIQPDAWIVFLPSFLRELSYANTILAAFSVYEILLALWLVSGRKIFYAAILSSLTLLSIITVSLNALIITFRDLAILAASAALAVLNKE